MDIRKITNYTIVGPGSKNFCFENPSVGGKGCYKTVTCSVNQSQQVRFQRL